MRAVFLSTVFLLAAALGACQFGENDQEVVTPPTLLRFTVPADSATNVYEPGGLDVVARFREEIRPERVTTLQMFPPPRARGAVDFSVPKQIVIPDVVFDPRVPVHRWLIDGPDFVEPVLVGFHPGERIVTEGFLHGDVTRNGSRDRAVGALVFVLAYDVPDTLLPTNATTMLGLPVVTVSRIEDRFASIPNLYVNNLVPGRRYALVVIQDTDGDGRHEPREDWWGYPHEAFTVDRIELTRAGRSSDVENPIARVPIEIVPPGALDPDDFQRAVVRRAQGWRPDPSSP